jgi:hypothetical protein
MAFKIRTWDWVRVGLMGIANILGAVILIIFLSVLAMAFIMLLSCLKF